MKKKIIASVAAIAIASLGFSVAPASAADESSCGTAAGFCVGLVTDVGKVDDKSFNQSAWQGAKTAAAALNGFSKYIETQDPKDYASNIDLFASKKYNVIVTVGFLMADATAIAAAKYPDIKFIGVDQYNASPATNYTGLGFPEDKAGFIVGYLGGYLTKSGKTAAIAGGPSSIPPVRKFIEGFRNGVAYAAKEQKKKYPKSSTVYYTGANAFNDPAWGASTAAQYLTQGYDVIFAAGGKTGNGALARIAKKKGAFCIGVDTDQWATVPEAQPCLVTSSMKNIPQGVQVLIKQVKSGTFAGGNFLGSVGAAPYHALAKKVPAKVKAKVKALTAKVLAGTVATGVK
ncbi:MAG: BMP family ABC transporter substrate-binding protein [Actinomycetota bacterium]